MFFFPAHKLTLLSSDSLGTGIVCSYEILDFLFSGRGYLDNVNLVSARRGAGVPARWVQTCICPPGHEGDSCERCSAGFSRSIPADGAFSPCKLGGYDSENPDHFSADETPTMQRCQSGFYRDPRQGGACVQCPCAEGESCSLPPGSVYPRCDRCPPGTSGESRLPELLKASVSHEHLIQRVFPQQKTQTRSKRTHSSYKFNYATSNVGHGAEVKLSTSTQRIRFSSHLANPCVKVLKCYWARH